MTSKTAMTSQKARARKDAFDPALPHTKLEGTNYALQAVPPNGNVLFDTVTKAAVPMTTTFNRHDGVAVIVGKKLAFNATGKKLGEIDPTTGALKAAKAAPAGGNGGKNGGKKNQTKQDPAPPAPDQQEPEGDNTDPLA